MQADKPIPLYGDPARNIPGIRAARIFVNRQVDPCLGQAKAASTRI